MVEYRAPDQQMRLRIWENLLRGNGIGDNSNGTQQQLTLAPDVDLAALAAKYELTGGFIKNAVLSALLSALSRVKQVERSSSSGDGGSKATAVFPFGDGGTNNGNGSGSGSGSDGSSATVLPEEPVICHDDLVRGCRLQMRGSLTGGVASADPSADAQCGVDDLELAPAIREAAQAVLRFERARARVYGTWVAPHPALAGGDSKNGNVGLAQKGTIFCLVGPAGSGKRTLARALAHDLGRATKTIHFADVAGSSSASSSSSSDVTGLVAVVRDARLSDSIIVVDGFEHAVTDDHEGAAKLPAALSRVLEVLHGFPGTAVLLCHLDSPHGLTLQRDFASRLFGLVRFSPQLTPHDVRSRLWQALVPSAAPLEPGINFAELGRRFELSPGSIQSAVARACAESAMRDQGPGCAVRHKDLVAAGDAEVAKLRGGGASFEIIAKMFN